MTDSWFDQLDHAPCPECSRRVLAMHLCEHSDPLCSTCCRAHHPRICPRCAGTGQHRPGVLAGLRNYDPSLKPCPDCNTTGTLNKDTA